MSSYNSNSSWLSASTNTLTPVPSARANTALEAFPRGEHASLKTAVKTKTALRIIFHYLKVDMKTVPAHEKEATEIQRVNGAEHWVVSAGMLRELTTEFNAMVRACLRFSTHTQRRHRITTEETLALAGMLRAGSCPRSPRRRTVRPRSIR